MLDKQIDKRYYSLAERETERTTKLKEITTMEHKYNFNNTQRYAIVINRGFNGYEVLTSTNDEQEAQELVQRNGNGTVIDTWTYDLTD